MMNDYLSKGVPILYDGPECECINPNWDSTKTFKTDVLACINNDILLGRKSGPYDSVPCPNFRSSPLGAFAKKRTGKVRIIHDLSWPPGESVNEYIPSDLCSVNYISIDDAVREVKIRGPGSLMSKLDLQDAYKCIVVRPEDYHYLGSSWVGEDGKISYFLDHVLPFGLRSSANLFDLFATGLEFSMFLGGCSNICHYLDDYFTCGSASTNECADNLKIMLKSCVDLGMPVNPKKTVQPTTKIEFLGIIINSETMLLSMSDERIADVLIELEFWLNRKVGSKRKLLSLLGKLVFMCRVIQPGRIFIRRLFTASTRVKVLHHRVKLCNEALKDIRWWVVFIKIWNGKSLFYDDEWVLSSKLSLATDASNLGMGATFENSWWMVPFNSAHLKFPIAWRELFAIVVACRVWGHALSSKRVMIECDNMAVVYSVNNGTSKNQPIMTLIRDLFFVCSFYSFDVKLKHVAGILNIGPDLLSRLKLEQFKERFPAADRFSSFVHPSFLSF